MPTYAFSVESNITTVVSSDGPIKTTSQPTRVECDGAGGYQIAEMNLAFNYDQIESLTNGGSPIDPLPDDGVPMAQALQSMFPQVGTVTITPAVTIENTPIDVYVTNDPVNVNITGGVPTNTFAVLMDATQIIASGTTLAQTNTMFRGGIITITTQSKSLSPSVTFYLEEYNEATQAWESLGQLTGAVTTDTTSKRTVYPGATDAALGLIPKTWRVSWVFTGTGEFYVIIGINYVV